MSETATCAKPGCGAQKILGYPCTDWDCPQQTVEAGQYAALKERFYLQIDYAIDLQRIIEDLCNSREIRPPQGGARHHYDMAVAHHAALSQANSTTTNSQEQKP